MNAKTETRMQKIRQRTKQYQKQYEIQLLSCLTACSLLPLIGIAVLLRQIQTPGILAEANGYSSVLLQDGAGIYVVIGIASFVVGVSVTLLCIRLNRHLINRTASTEESEE